MGVVKGDRIKESQKLNKVSLEAFFAYALFVDVLPDDFGRFRCNPKLAAGHLAPRRDDVTAELVGRVFAEYEREELIRTWEVDGERFGEFTGFKPRGNKYHRTPEPPWSEHQHNGRCLATAIHRAKEWGDLKGAEALSIRMKQLRDRDPASRRAVRQEAATQPDHTPAPATFSPTPPFPSVPLHSPPTEDGPPAGAGPGRLGRMVKAAVEARAPGVESVIPAVVTVVSADVWSQQAADDWKAAYKSKPPKQFFAALKPIAKEYGWARTRPVLQAYLADTPVDLLSIARVLPVRIEGGNSLGRASPGKPSVGDRAMASAAEFLKQGER